jgi:hypothetical protein
MSTMPKNETIPVDDEEFALNEVTHSNRPRSPSVPPLGPASIKPALDAYLNSILYRVSDDRSELRAAYV